jgi:hypothetical protein
LAWSLAHVRGRSPSAHADQPQPSDRRPENPRDGYSSRLRCVFDPRWLQISAVQCFEP